MLSQLSRVAIKLLQAPVYFYRYVISPWLPKSCRYHPTCSRYMIEALEKHGAVKGLYLGIRRVLSCHPWSRRNYDDPVP
ncbi:MAG: membrane protein insertion efficiency factor YidD [Alphaproteobacteria bacterium]